MAIKVKLKFELWICIRFDQFSMASYYSSKFTCDMKIVRHPLLSVEVIKDRVGSHFKNPSFFDFLLKSGPKVTHLGISWKPLLWKNVRPGFVFLGAGRLISFLAKRWLWTFHCLVQHESFCYSWLGRSWLDFCCQRCW